jgi:hypothetical protein
MTTRPSMRGPHSGRIDCVRPSVGHGCRQDAGPLVVCDGVRHVQSPARMTDIHVVSALISQWRVGLEELWNL